MKQLWTDKYRPKSMSEYVFKDKKQKIVVERWIKSGVLPNMLLSGSPGTGKSSLIKMLLKELDVNPFDILEVNASKDNGVDYIRDVVTRFSDTMGVGTMRYVFLDEFDFCSPAAQATLRGVIEKYSTSVRFLLTANLQHKIIDAIKSRCEAGRMHIENLDKSEFITKLITILDNESVEIDPDALEAIVNKTYPDLRRGINMAQANVVDSKLTLPDVSTESTVSDYMLAAVELFKAKQYTNARKLICKEAKQEEYDDIYRFLYQNIELWGSEEQQEKAIIIIRDGLVKDISVADREINLSATLVELSMLANEKM